MTCLQSGIDSYFVLGKASYLGSGTGCLVFDIAFFLELGTDACLGPGTDCLELRTVFCLESGTALYLESGTDHLGFGTGFYLDSGNDHLGFGIDSRLEPGNGFSLGIGTVYFGPGTECLDSGLDSQSGRLQPGIDFFLGSGTVDFRRGTDFLLSGTDLCFHYRIGTYPVTENDHYFLYVLAHELETGFCSANGSVLLCGSGYFLWFEVETSPWWTLDIRLWTELLADFCSDSGRTSAGTDLFALVSELGYTDS